jgi:hypothetical protein
MSKSKSILEMEYKKPENRPYSQDELLFYKNKLFKNLNIGTNKAYHEQCEHSYFVKIGGRKENKINENDKNIGNCSVCWKFHKTPNNLKETAKGLINTYYNKKDKDYLTYDDVDLESSFYLWLYNDFN